MKNILIVTPFKSVTPHFETELEIARLHKENGDRVTVLSCLGELAACDLNVHRDQKQCAKCIAKRRDGWGLVEGVTIEPILKTKIKFPYASTLTSAPKNADEVKQWMVDGTDAGWGLLSSLVSIEQTPDVDLRKIRWITRRLAASSETIYRRMVSILKDNKINCVYVFNGRLALCRAVVRACERTKTKYYVHERGCNNHHYSLYENSLPHDIQKTHEAILSKWSNDHDAARRQQLSEEWFQKRRHGTSEDWYSFLGQQSRRKLPEGWIAERHNVVVFTSSEDEFASIGDVWVNKLYESQYKGVQCLVSDLQVLAPNAHVTVRMHPNQKRLRGGETEALRRLQASNVTVLAPESDVDTYALIDNASVVVSFGSTVGIEAVYWNKPSVLLGPSFYQDLGAAYKVATHEDALDAILRPKLGDKEMALAYGYWANTRGEAYKYYEPDDFYTGTFCGVNLDRKIYLSWGKRMYWSVEKRSRAIFEALFWWL